MYIPNSEIRLIKNINLDSSYTNTIYFENLLEQTNYFYTKADKIFSNCNIVKEHTNTIRLQGNAVQFYNYNYMMFRNTNFGGKWFYAFINEVRYLNENTTEFVFEIDVMQTWMFDITHQDSLIEREHTKTDNLYEHIIRENIDGNFTKKVMDEEILFDINYEGLVVVVYFSTDKLESDTLGRLDVAPPSIYGGTYVSCFVQAYAIDDFKNVVDFLVAEGKADAIISTFLFPLAFLPLEEIDDMSYPQTSNVTKYDFNVIIPDNLDGYTPRNKKLLQYPYLYSSVLTRAGSFDIEYQQLDNPLLSRIEIAIPLNPEPIGKIYMRQYRGVEFDYETSVNLTGFPLMPYLYSMYINSYNANKTANALFALNSATDIVSGGMRLYGGDVRGGTDITNTLSNVTNNLATIHDDFNRPPTSKNQSQGVDSYLSMGIVDGISLTGKGLSVSQQVISIKNQYAKMLDEYFDRYGYKVLRTGKISYKNRENYTYIKTIEPNFIGNFDNVTKNKIINIFNNGITFWVNPSKIGDYTISNNTLN